jgi:hypothetical protein
MSTIEDSKITLNNEHGPILKIITMNKIILLLITLIPSLSFAASSSESIDLTGHAAGYIALIIFVSAYFFVMIEEFTPS